MRLALVAAVAALIIPATASAQSMNAEVYYKRALALKAKGPLALLSQGEINALVTEAQNAGKASREQRLAAIRAGKPKRACPPEKASMDSDEFMKRLAAIPAAERARINMTEAMTRITIARFPCPR